MAESGSNRNPDAVPSFASPSPLEPAVGRSRHILIAEDSKSDVFLIRQALQKSGIEAQLHFTDDGEKAIKYIEQADADPAAPTPDLVLLDINMPRYKGGDIMRRLRASTRCSGAIVLIVTSSDSDRDRDQMNQLGVDGYFRKPSEFSEYMKLGQIVRELLARKERPLC